MTDELQARADELNADATALDVPPEIDQLASLARTALSDPYGLPQGEYEKMLPGPLGEFLTQRQGSYAVDRLDEIINLLNPAEMTAAGGARALTVLGRHVADVLERLEAEDGLERNRSLIGDEITASLDHLDNAIAALNRAAEGEVSS